MFNERKRVVFFGLPLSFTSYIVEDENLRIKSGFFNQAEENCYMYKIIDITLKRSLMERIFGLGTIVCSTGDVSTPIITLKHIKRSADVKQFIFEKSEAHRVKRRTVNTLDINMQDNDSDQDLDQIN